ncbi:MAG: hypothetical protein KDA21_02845 [Phycisphaerales bacterium]|nr:hypothetical protein [Phycisphaerales bacterium]
MSHDHDHPHNADELKQELEHHDEWFRHAADEPAHMEAHGRINSVFIIGYLALTILIVLVIAIGVVQYVKSSVRDLRQHTAETVVPRGRYFGPGSNEVGADAIRQWHEDLDQWRWVKKGEISQIPIDVAMDRVVEQYKN